MKRFLIVSILVLITVSINAQGVSPYSMRNIKFGIELNSDIWLNMPDTVKLKTINRGVNLYLMYQYKFKESNFGISAGLSVATQNMYLKNSYLHTSNGISEFQKFPADNTFKKNKLNLNFIELPLEINYMTKSLINFALGGKIGYLISDKTKYKGKEYTGDNSTEIKRKVHNNQNISDYRIGAYALVGYKWMNLTAYYGFTKLFEKDKGPEISPLTVGIIIRPY